jgi:glutaryl-CoA dehydrogenase
MPADATPYLLSIDHLLTEEERLVWTSTREFAERRIGPTIVEHYENATFPLELIAEFGEHGLLGAPLAGYGCANMNPVEYGLTMIELERQDSGIRSFCSVQTALVMWPIHTYGSDAQKDRWLPGMAKGELVGCFGLTEPNSGSDPGSMRTQNKRVQAATSSSRDKSFGSPTAHSPMSASFGRRRLSTASRHRSFAGSWSSAEPRDSRRPRPKAS